MLYEMVMASGFGILQECMEDDDLDDDASTEWNLRSF